MYSEVLISVGDVDLTIFLFQAEDGIRDLVRSRGLGDVYKRQVLDGMALGWPAEPDDLFVDDSGNPVRIDKAFSWELSLIHI